MQYLSACISFVTRKKAHSVLACCFLFLMHIAGQCQEPGSEKSICQQPVPPGWVCTKVGKLCDSSISPFELDNYKRDIIYYVGLPGGSKIYISADTIPAGWVKTFLALGPAIPAIIDHKLGSRIFFNDSILKLEGYETIDSLSIIDNPLPEHWLGTYIKGELVGNVIYSRYYISRISTLNPHRWYTNIQTISPPGWLTTGVGADLHGAGWSDLDTIENYLAMPIGKIITQVGTSQVDPFPPPGWSILDTGSYHTPALAIYPTLTIRKNKSIISGNLSGTLAKSGSPYYIDGHVTVPEHERLYIEPGVTIYSIQNGNTFNVDGSLIAVGTAEDSIRFLCLLKPDDTISTKGAILNFRDSSKKSVLSYVSFNGWGCVNYAEESAISIATSSVKITHCSIANCRKNGIYIALTKTPVIEENNFSANFTDIDIDILNLQGVTNNINAGILLRQFSYTMVDTIMLTKAGPGSYYVINGDLHINRQSYCKILPGVEVRWLGVRRDMLTVEGTLIAEGTDDEPILFNGYNQFAPDYATRTGGVLYFTNYSSNSIVSHAKFNDWGSKGNNGLGAININTSDVSIKHTTISNSATAGITFMTEFIYPVIDHNDFRNNPVGIQSFITNCTNVKNNTNAKILIVASGISQQVISWPFPGEHSYYTLRGQVIIPFRSALTIGAGSLVDFGNDGGSIVVSGTLHSAGTKDSLIRFERLLPPLNSGADGYLELARGDSTSEVNYTSFNKAGNTSVAALLISKPAAAVSNITISNSVSAGLEYYSEGEQIIANSTFSNNQAGVVSITGSPVLLNCNIYNNVDYGVNNISNNTNDTVDARSCYWGTTSGPFHPVLNPGGTGNRVSDKVKFSPYRSALLPVTLTSFTAAKIKAGVLLQWKTTRELNMRGYSIERSADNRRFTAIGYVRSQGGTANTYFFTDNKPAPLNNYYRLKAEDHDARYTYSETRRISFSEPFAVAVVPNPVASGRLSVMLNATSTSKVSATISSADGKVVYSKDFNVNTGVQTKIIDISLFADGAYILTIATEGYVKTIKFMKAGR